MYWSHVCFVVLPLIFGRTDGDRQHLMIMKLVDFCYKLHPLVFICPSNTKYICMICVNEFARKIAWVEKRKNDNKALAIKEIETLYIQYCSKKHIYYHHRQFYVPVSTLPWTNEVFTALVIALPDEKLIRYTGTYSSSYSGTRFTGIATEVIIDII